MPMKKREKVLSVDNLRHMEYYGMQEIFDELYAKANIAVVQASKKR